MIRNALLVSCALLLIAPVCFADSLKDRIAVHGSTGLYLPQDKQGGGFRFGGGGFSGGGGEREVEIDDGIRWELGVQWGFREKKSVWALEFEAAYFKEGVGAETTFQDPDASTIQRVPGPGGVLLQVGASGDEEQLPMNLGEITMMPLSANLLWHFGHRRGKASAYGGGGLSYVLTDFEINPRYRDFVGYNDGDIDDGPALNLKGGIQVWLDENWIFDFHANYLLTDEQFRWQGTNTTYGTQSFDLNDDQLPDIFGQPADYRRVDPGNIRLDGLAFSVGIRYAFPRFRNKEAGGGS